MFKSDVDPEKYVEEKGLKVVNDEVPKPKHFKNSFTADGRLQESQEGYFRLIAERLAKKEVITDAQAAQVNINNVVLKGVAKSSFVSESWQ